MIPRQFGSHNVVDGSSNAGVIRSLDNNSFLDTTKANPMSLRGLPIAQTFPSLRMSASSYAMPQLNNLNGIHNNISNNSSLIGSFNVGDGPLPLSMLVDAAMGTASTVRRKRSMDESSSRSVSATNTSSIRNPYKKQKMFMETNSSKTNNNNNLLNGSNPVLMQRLSNLSGGFPMPKFHGRNSFGQQQVQNISSSDKQQKQKNLSTKIGAFPMPPLKVQRSMESFAPALYAYKQVWEEACGVKDVLTDANHTAAARRDGMEFRKELFSRRLQAGTVRIEGKHRKMLYA